MTKITRALGLLAASVILAVLAIVGGSPTASAGTCTPVPGPDLCGKVTNLSGSVRTLIVGDNWNGTCTGTRVYIGAGRTSPFKDTDCFEVPAGSHAHVGTLTYKAGRDVKVYDGQHIRVTLHKGSSH